MSEGPSSKVDIEAIDWTDREDCTCVCAFCSNQFRSPSKLVFGPVNALVSKRPCPQCGKHDLSRSSSDPELQVIR